MDIEIIKITPKDNIGKKLNEAKEKSVFNNMPVLIKLVDYNGKSRKKDEAYLVSRDYFAEIIGDVYEVISNDSASFSEDEFYEQDNFDFNRLKRLINELHEKSFGGKIAIESIDNPKTINVEMELFPAIDSRSSLSETIYLDETGQLDDISMEDRILLDQGFYHFLQFEQATYDIERRSKVEDQLDKYKSAKNGKNSLERIERIESNLRLNPMYEDIHLEKLAGKYRDLWSRRINGKDRYVYSIRKEQHKLIVHSVRGHYDNLRK